MYAEALNESAGAPTVESYQAHIKEKLALQSSRDLVQRAIEWRLGDTAR